MFSREWPWIRSLFGNKIRTFCWPTPHFAYLKSNEIGLFWGSNWWHLVNSWEIPNFLPLFATSWPSFEAPPCLDIRAARWWASRQTNRGGRSSALAPCPVTRRRLGRLGGGRDSPSECRSMMWNFDAHRLNRSHGIVFWLFVLLYKSTWGDHDGDSSCQG
jgi:hypothetical protein